MLRTVIAVAALALALPVSAPANAQAQGLNSLTIIDEGGDMWRYPNAEPPAVPAPNQHRNDIRRTKIRHGLHAITIRTKFVELSRKPEFYILAVGLRISAGVRRDLDIFVDGADWQGSADLRRANGRVVKCGLSHRINYTRNVIHLRVPRSCLKDPRWVQANVFTLGAFDPKAIRMVGDSAHGPQRPPKLVWTQRLHRPQVG
jgi:hypothetical protein